MLPVLQLKFVLSVVYSGKIRLLSSVFRVIFLKLIIMRNNGIGSSFLLSRKILGFQMKIRKKALQLLIFRHHDVKKYI